MMRNTFILGAGGLILFLTISSRACAQARPQVADPTWKVEPQSSGPLHEGFVQPSRLNGAGPGSSFPASLPIRFRRRPPTWRLAAAMYSGFPDTGPGMRKKVSFSG